MLAIILRSPNRRSDGLSLSTGLLSFDIGDGAFLFHVIVYVSFSYFIRTIVDHIRALTKSFGNSSECKR